MEIRDGFWMYGNAVRNDAKAAKASGHELLGINIDFETLEIFIHLLLLLSRTEEVLSMSSARS